MSDFRDRDHIKSYAIRATRMSDAQRRAYDRLHDRFCIRAQTTPVDPRSFFPEPDHPLYLEIGFGMGDATAEIARMEPGTNLLGIEVHKPGVGKLLAAIERHGLRNIRIIHDDALIVVEQMIPPNSLDGVLLFFPDPWPKKRHQKRRIVRDSFVRLITSRLKPGAFFYAVTDWEEYAERILEVLDRAEGLENSYERFAAPQPWRPTTSFERKGRAAGRPIREIHFRRA